jgi:hypothetical protein
VLQSRLQEEVLLKGWNVLSILIGVLIGVVNQIMSEKWIQHC